MTHEKQHIPKLAQGELTLEVSEHTILKVQNIVRLYSFNDILFLKKLKSNHKTNVITSIINPEKVIELVTIYI